MKPRDHWAQRTPPRQHESYLNSLQARSVPFEPVSARPDLDSTSEFPALGEMKSPAQSHGRQVASHLPSHMSSLHANSARGPSLALLQADLKDPSAAHHFQDLTDDKMMEFDPPSTEQFGLKGLLKIIRMTDPDLNTLALGTDLTTLGLDLNSTEVLYPHFSSPFSDTSSSQEPEYQLPECYYKHPPALKTSHLSKFSLETLFYIFYSMPRDTLQVFACKELYAREWRYHKELQLWFTRPKDSTMRSLGYKVDSLVYFDTERWESRVYLNEGSALSFMSLEEVQSI